MGYKIESYSLNELHRIAVTGSVAPSLFWVLPVGHWNSNQLDSVWKTFTTGDNKCHNFGLLLVKDPYQRQSSDSTNLDLASIGAKLSDLMPAGVERFIGISKLKPDSSYMLVLSGAYPQPGWGVLVHLKSQEALNNLISLTMDSTVKQEDLEIFLEANHKYNQLNTTLSLKPQKPNLSELESDIRKGNKLKSLIQEIEDALQNDQHLDVQEKIAAYTSSNPTGPTSWLIIEPILLQQLCELQKSYASACFILAVPVNIITNEIETLIESLSPDPSQRRLVYEGLADPKLKHVLRECYSLRTKGIVSIGESFTNWAEQTKSLFKPLLAALIKDLTLRITDRLVGFEVEHQRIEGNFNNSIEEWRNNCKKYRENFHKTLGLAVDLQWKLGPNFLVELEANCRENKIDAISIPWDPARMVGWKIFTSNIGFELNDLKIYAKDIAPNLTIENALNLGTNENADGSYFTDYVHYIAMSKSGLSPRSITRDFITRLVSPSKMQDLIKKHSGQTVSNTNTNSIGLAEELLHAFGWRESEIWLEKSLAGCITTCENNYFLLEGLNSNEIRIVLESFCKDLLDVFVANLGYQHQQLWDVIDERIPDYRHMSRSKDWQEEMRSMTMGSAVIILDGLGPIAFPYKIKEIKRSIENLRTLSRVLNKSSHHQENDSLSHTTDPINIAETIKQLLDNTETIVGEMPWHMKISFVYGDQPKVLSGEAWSHSSHAPRLLKVLEWSSGMIPDTNITFWNTTQQNPIVPNPMFIARPKR